MSKSNSAESMESLATVPRVRIFECRPVSSSGFSSARQPAAMIVDPGFVFANRPTKRLDLASARPVTQQVFTKITSGESLESSKPASFSSWATDSVST